MSLPPKRRIFVRQKRRAGPAGQIAVILLAAVSLLGLAGVGVAQMQDRQPARPAPHPALLAGGGADPAHR